MADEEPKAPTANPPVNLDWMARTIQWGTRAHIHPQAGLTLGAINTGAYAEIPDYWESQTRMPRGAATPPGYAATRIGGYYLRNKSDLWADNAPELYEEAISRRWASADSVPWTDCAALPGDVEAAVCQVATELSQQASIEVDVVASWLQAMAHGYHEVKIYLATEIFDAARAFETFRKRALVNGTGLGIESPGQVNRLLLESRAGWTETCLVLHILRGTFTQTVCRYLAAYAPSAVERRIGEGTMQDKARHRAYAMQHIRYAILHVPEMGTVLNLGLGQAEAIVGRDDADPVLWEALACIFGSGVRGMDEGMRVVAAMRRRYVQDYVKTLRWIGLDRGAALAPNFKKLLEA